jgi:hypothetical protein
MIRISRWVGCFAFFYAGVRDDGGEFVTGEKRASTSMKQAAKSVRWYGLNRGRCEEVASGSRNNVLASIAGCRCRSHDVAQEKAILNDTIEALSRFTSNPTPRARWSVTYSTKSMEQARSGFFQVTPDSSSPATALSVNLPLTMSPVLVLCLPSCSFLSRFPNPATMTSISPTC